MEQKRVIDKKEFRYEGLRQRGLLTALEKTEKSERIMDLLIHSKEFQKAEQILSYADCKGEVETDRLFMEAKRMGKQVFYPKVLGDLMDFYRVTALQALTPGYFGIREPESSPAALWRGGAASLVIVPGVAFDTEGGRIGYGKGYYDRFLSLHATLFSAGICFTCQLCDRIPGNVHDIPVSVLFTENGMLRTEQSLR